MKAVRSLETGKKATADDIEPRRLTQRLVTPHPDRLSYIRYAFERGMTVREVARMTSMDPGSCTRSNRSPMRLRPLAACRWRR